MKLLVNEPGGGAPGPAPPTPGPAARYWQQAPVSTLLLVVIISIHLVNHLLGGGDDPWTLQRMGANFKLATLHGEPWRLISSIFLHGGILHLLVNSYALYVLGRLGEQLYGATRFWLIFAVAGIFGAAASAGLGEVYRLSVGASGAIFGLLGAVLVLFLRLKGYIPDDRRKSAIIHLLAVLGLNLYIGFSVSMVDNSAHIGGLIGGALAGYLVMPSPGKLHPLWTHRVIRWTAWLMVALSVLSAVMVVITPSSRTLLNLPRERIVQGEVSVERPLHWIPARTKRLVLKDPLVRPLLLLEYDVQYFDQAITFDQYAREYSLSFAVQLKKEPEVRDVRPTSEVLRNPGLKGVLLTRMEMRLFKVPYRQLIFFRQIGRDMVLARVSIPAALEEYYLPLLWQVAGSMRTRSLGAARPASAAR